jgi:hypothetical protein
VEETTEKSTEEVGQLRLMRPDQTLILYTLRADSTL